LAALLIRRRWWVIIPFAALFSMLAMLIKQLPRIYVSESLVLVRPRDVPENFVMDLTSSSTQQRLQSIKQTVMSRNNIVAILNEFKDRLPELRRLNIDEAVEKLRNQIDIQFITTTTADPRPIVTSFKILYEHRIPETAQQICSKLTKLFIDQDSRSRESKVFGTTDFLKAELEKKSAELQESDLKLQSLKSKNQTELPQQFDANQRALDRLNEQKTANAESLVQAATQKFNLEQTLAQVPEFLTPAQIQLARPPAPPEDPTVQEFRRTESEYRKLRLLYTDRHQDVQTVKKELDRLRELIGEEAAERALKPPKPIEPEEKIVSKPTVNPAYVSLKNSLRELETDTELKRRDADRIKRDIAMYERRVESTPQVELQLSAILRENEDIRKDYQDLKDKLTQAELSGSMETKQRGDQFITLDQANFPIASTKPKKWALLLVSFLFSLSIGVAIAIAADVVRQRIWTQSEVEALWGVPVLIDIPEIVTDDDMVAIGRRKWVAAGASLAAAALLSLCLYGIHLKQAAILERLDPVLEKLVYK
jgi:uncharacterized protein involved in exopolysaccharide biosynthesis